MTRAGALDFRAGPGALQAIQKHGFAAEMVGTMAGASGGAKWLVLSKLDRVVADTVIPRLRGPVYLIGSSIGAWRFACYAQAKPLEAIARFEAAYLGQTYSDDPDRDEITAKSREIMDLLTELRRAEGITIIMVTHEADMAQYADRIIRFVDGLIAADGAPRKAA